MQSVKSIQIQEIINYCGIMWEDLVFKKKLRVLTLSL